MTEVSTDERFTGDFYAPTAAEWLRRWDAGDVVSTVEMGGLGPGYEQAIQTLVAELIRDCADKPMPAVGDKDAWWNWGNDTIKRIDDACGGFSGAQVGAAKSLAAAYINRGPRTCFKELEDIGKWKERSILVSTAWPKVPK